MEKRGRLDTKAIVLHETGIWDIKDDDELTGEAGDGTGRRPQPLHPYAATIGNGTVSGAGDIGAREVIELD